MVSKKVRRIAAAMASTAAAATLLAACGSGSSSSTATTSSGATKVSGGTVNFAEGPGATPNYIFPLSSGAYFSVTNLSQFQELMYRPLYWFGQGTTPVINYKLSLANPPVFSNNDKTVTVTLKNYKWSNGASVDARDVVFWMNMLKANKANWAAYVPGAFPDNVVSYQATGPNTVVFNLNGSYNPTWFTYNELSQITPMPMAWDVTAAGQTAPSETSTTAPDLTPTGAQAVYKFLDAQAKDTATYTTSPIWSVVDGPWKLQSFTSQGKAVFVPNPTYSGPVKPTISKFVELPFTTDSAEFNVLRSGSGLDYGYIPVADLSQKSLLTSSGFTFNPWILFSFNYWVVNFNNPTVGPIIDQAYVRQAIQHLVDQPQWISSFLKGYGVPSYGPVPIVPANSFADQKERSNPYPFSVSAATDLLKSHGWTINANGTDTCTNPGTGANQCGKGIAQGAPLTFNLQYASGVQATDQMMAALKSAGAQAGININLTSAPFDQVIGNATPCTATQAACKWQMENWGGGWVYAPDYYPTGGELYQTGAGANFGSYTDPKADSLIATTHTAPASQTQSALNAYQDYIVQSLPVIFQPNADYQLSEVRSTLHGVQQNAYGNLLPEEWYFTK
ncbi:MAG: peptide ABC transporter substrate-binding protein [Nitrospiraceae bacterium]|nr:peptide ABC transporter substrate-binding protein [Nitrospiraceae bacterium]